MLIIGCALRVKCILTLCMGLCSPVSLYHGAMGWSVFVIVTFHGLPTRFDITETVQIRRHISNCTLNHIRHIITPFHNTYAMARSMDTWFLPLNKYYRTELYNTHSMARVRDHWLLSLNKYVIW